MPQTLSQTNMSLTNPDVTAVQLPDGKLRLMVTVDWSVDYQVNGLTTVKVTGFLIPDNQTRELTNQVVAEAQAPPPRKLRKLK